MTRSFSLQFTARELRNRPVPWALGPAATPVQMGAGMTFMITAPPALAGDADKIQLEAETIGVSCERIKELLLLELALTDEWKGKVDLLINSSLPENRDPALTGIYSADGWRYELELPKIISVEKFVRAVVQTLLQEMVNRTAGSRSAEVPFWLVEGFSAHLQSFNVPTYIIRSNQQTPWGENMRVKGMADVRAALRRHEPLTFQQLCWPEQSDVAGKDETVYRGCAQLLFEGLLHFNDGQMSFQRFLTDMPGHLNWQLAFLQAFHGHFARLLNVRKMVGFEMRGVYRSGFDGARHGKGMLGQIAECAGRAGRGPAGAVAEPGRSALDVARGHHEMEQHQCPAGLATDRARPGESALVCRPLRDGPGGVAASGRGAAENAWGAKRAIATRPNRQPFGRPLPGRSCQL